MSIDAPRGVLQPPPYFEAIRRKAETRWDQLESDPELAGPWRQLFRQVQSPRHVLSELLQNADDAGARRVSVCLKENLFVFGHDGADFTENDFESLCRFGFSNKRNLHTIGFRGIGFKSTFSLGDVVEVLSPTLAVHFHKRRFTAPRWISRVGAVPHTNIRVKIENNEAVKELRKNLDEWSESAVSLLFFRSIEQLKIQDRVIKRQTTGPGPVPDSEWIELSDSVTHELLVVRSGKEPFPEESYAEIQEERFAEEIDLPPCRVELVLGLSSNRLYVVLPTDVRLRLPFSSNATFVQDPARNGIKDPSLSPTNRWLFSRIARLAAETMLEWLGNNSLSLGERAQAYRLLCVSSHDEESLAKACENRICSEFRRVCEKRPVLLTSGEKVVFPGEAIAPPLHLYSVWRDKILSRIFSPDGKPVVAGEIQSSHLKGLAKHDWIREIPDEDAVTYLKGAKRPPRPDDWEALSHLWNFVRQTVKGISSRREVNLIPAEHNAHLYCADEVVRLSRGRSVLQPEDGDFLAQYVVAIDPGWVAYLSQQPDSETTRSKSHRRSASELLREMRLDSPSSWDRVVGAAAEKVFARTDTDILERAVRLTHIMAAVNARVPKDFHYVTRDETTRTVDQGIVVDPKREVEEFVPSDWADCHFLHESYLKELGPVHFDAWSKWILSESSGLHIFPKFVERTRDFSSVHDFESHLRDRDVAVPDIYSYRSERSTVTDYDFDPQLLEYWDEQASTDPQLWCSIVQSILLLPARFWEKFRYGEAREISKNGHSKPAQCDPIPATWITRLKGERCLPDVYSRLHIPAALLMRTPETEPLLGVEPFVKSELDTAQTQPLLKQLGVRDTPAGADSIIQRICALAEADEPLIEELVKWYPALDKVVARMSNQELEEIQARFVNERLILSSDMQWTTSEEIFRAQDDEVLPDAPIIHQSVAALPLWSKLGVSERPKLELILQWLRQLDSGVRLDQQTIPRVRACIKRFPEQVWSECRHWLALDGSWQATDELELACVRSSGVHVADLFTTVKARTADLRMLSADSAESRCFRPLRDLGQSLEYRITDTKSSHAPTIIKPWMSALGIGLQRVRLSDEQETDRIRKLGRRLAATQWHVVTTLLVTPYLDGTPAGEPHSPDVVWHESILHVRNVSFARLFNALVDELSRPFANPGICDAVKSCTERDVNFVTAYLEHNFDLEEIEVVTDADEPEKNEHRTESGDTRPEATDAGSDPATERTAVESIDRFTQLEQPGPIDEESDSTGRPRARTRPLMSRFAESLGYRWHADRELWLHHDGSSLRKSMAIFHLEQLSPEGHITRRYWISQQRLESGIELSAELWQLLSQSPDATALVLLHGDDAPVVIAGDVLQRMKRDGEVELFPASYRLNFSEFELRRRLNTHEIREKESARPHIRPTAASRPISESNGVFTYETKGIVAKGFPRSGGFIVLAGSQMVKECVDSISAGNRQRREELIESGHLADRGNAWLLTQDIVFNSPSQAASIVSGNNVNGKMLWIDSNGRTLAEHMD